MFQDVNRPIPSLSFERMVAGHRAFTREFPGQVWLEVLLLGGITGLESEVKRSRNNVRTIAPARVQLNSVNRPRPRITPRACRVNDLPPWAGSFPARVDVISDGPADGGPLEAGASCDDAEILALLGRRPCTPDDVARGLGLHCAGCGQEAQQHVACGQGRARCRPMAALLRRVAVAPHPCLHQVRRATPFICRKFAPWLTHRSASSSSTTREPHRASTP